MFFISFVAILLLHNVVQLLIVPLSSFHFTPLFDLAEVFLFVFLYYWPYIIGWIILFIVIILLLKFWFNTENKLLKILIFIIPVILLIFLFWFQLPKSEGTFKHPCKLTGEIERDNRYYEVASSNSDPDICKKVFNPDNLTYEPYSEDLKDCYLCFALLDKYDCKNLPPEKQGTCYFIKEEDNIRKAEDNNNEKFCYSLKVSIKKEGCIHRIKCWNDLLYRCGYWPEKYEIKM